MIIDQNKSVHVRLEPTYVTKEQCSYMRRVNYFERFPSSASNETQ